MALLTETSPADAASTGEHRPSAEQAQALTDHLHGFQAVWIANIGLRTSLFQTIADVPGGLADGDLAARTGFDRRYLGVWLRAAFAYGFLDWDAEAGYRLAPGMAEALLDPASPRFMGGRYQFYAALHEDFLAFPAHLRGGGTWPRGEHDPWLLEALRNLTKPDAAMITGSVLPRIPGIEARLDDGGSILDVGCGGGSHIVHYARRFPCAHVAGLEPDPASLALARRTIAEAGMTERVRLIAGDANTLDADGAYDLITFSIALHETGGPVEYRDVLARTKRALKPGGAVVVSELPYPDSPAAYREHPVYRLLAGIQVHEALVGCGAIAQGELGAIMRDAGFADPWIIAQPIPTRFVMAAVKERGAAG